MDSLIRYALVVCGVIGVALLALLGTAFLAASMSERVERVAARFSVHRPPRALSPVAGRHVRPAGARPAWANDRPFVRARPYTGPAPGPRLVSWKDVFGTGTSLSTRRTVWPAADHVAATSNPWANAA